MILKIFTKPNCPKCPLAKALAQVSSIKKQVSRIEKYDTNTVDGMAEGAFYQVMSTPTVLLTNNDGKIVAEWRGRTPKTGEILSKIKHP